jgi:hypothetical protein
MWESHGMKLIIKPSNILEDNIKTGLKERGLEDSEQM